MRKTTIASAQRVCGVIANIAADKSISHRCAIFALLCDGACEVENYLLGEYTLHTLSIARALGLVVEQPSPTRMRFIPPTNGITEPSDVLDCGNAGTGMRLYAGLLAGVRGHFVLSGDKYLNKRPMKRIIEPLTLMGADITSVDGHAPLTIRGMKLHGIDYISKLASAQVKSCILLAGLNAEGKTTFEEPYVSRDHTERLFKYLEADIKTEGTKVTITPSQMIAKDIDVVGDISSAAFFIVAGLIVKGSDFVIKNVGINPTRSGILDVVERMGGGVNILNKRLVSGEPCADIRVQYNDSLKGCVIEGEDIPRLIDELPVVAVLASQAEGDTIVKNAEDLRNKESDRIKCLVAELTKIGVNIEETQDGFIVHGGRGKSVGKCGGKCEGKSLANNTITRPLESYHDHRLAMSFYIAGLVCGNEIAINGFEWTKISFPEFENLINILS